VGAVERGKIFVPTGEAGAFAIDPEAEFFFGDGGEAEVGVAGGEGFLPRREGVLVEG